MWGNDSDFWRRRPFGRILILALVVTMPVWLVAAWLASYFDKRTEGWFTTWVDGLLNRTRVRIGR